MVLEPLKIREVAQEQDSGVLEADSAAGPDGEVDLSSSSVGLVSEMAAQALG